MWNLRIIFGLISALTICASGYELYNSDSAVCCNGKLIYVPVARGHNHYYGCCYNKNHNVTAYNYYTQECCEGEVLDKPDEYFRYDCCGGQLYNYDSQICCQNTTHEKSEGYDNCCGDQPYNSDEKLCCKSWGRSGIETSTLYDNNGSQVECCEGQGYNVGEHFCCDGKLQPIPDSFGSDANVDCCRGVPYDDNKQACCMDFVKQKNKFWSISQVMDKEGNRTKCCGLQVYDDQTEVCCWDTLNFIVPKPAEADPNSQMSCCGGQVFSDDKHYCINGKLHVVEWNETSYRPMCGEEVYEPWNETCCGGQRLSDTSDKRCCWSTEEIYNPETQICCGSEVVQKRVTDFVFGFDSCCYPLVIRFM